MAYLFYNEESPINSFFQDCRTRDVCAQLYTLQPNIERISKAKSNNKNTNDIQDRCLTARKNAYFK